MALCGRSARLLAARAHISGRFGQRCCILRSVKARLRQLLPAGLLLLAATTVPALIWSPKGLARLEALEQQRKALQLEVQHLERDIERLTIQAESIKTSPASVERVARDELGLVRQTEVVMQFKKD